MVITGKLHAFHYKSRFRLLQGGDKEIVCDMYAYGEYKTGGEEKVRKFSGE